MDKTGKRSKREHEALPKTKEIREARTESTTIRGNNITRDPNALRSKGRRKAAAQDRLSKGREGQEERCQRQRPRPDTAGQKTGTGDAIKIGEIKASQKYPHSRIQSWPKNR